MRLRERKSTHAAADSRCRARAHPKPRKCQGDGRLRPAAPYSRGRCRPMQRSRPAVSSSPDGAAAKCTRPRAASPSGQATSPWHRGTPQALAPTQRNAAGELRAWQWQCQHRNQPAQQAAQQPALSGAWRSARRQPKEDACFRWRRQQKRGSFRGCTAVLLGRCPADGLLAGLKGSKRRASDRRALTCGDAGHSRSAQAFKVPLERFSGTARSHPPGE